MRAHACACVVRAGRTKREPLRKREPADHFSPKQILSPQKKSQILNGAGSEREGKIVGLERGRGADFFPIMSLFEIYSKISNWGCLCVSIRPHCWLPNTSLTLGSMQRCTLFSLCSEICAARCKGAVPFSEHCARGVFSAHMFL